MGNLGGPWSDGSKSFPVCRTGPHTHELTGDLHIIVRTFVGDRVVRPSKSFRFLWLALTSVTWLFFIYLASHKSQNPDILCRYSWKYFTLLCLAFALGIIVSVTNLDIFLTRVYDKRQTLTLFLGSLILTLGVTEFSIRIADPLGVSYLRGICSLSSRQDSRSKIDLPPSALLAHNLSGC